MDDVPQVDVPVRLVVEQVVHRDPPANDPAQGILGHRPSDLRMRRRRCSRRLLDLDLVQYAVQLRLGRSELGRQLRHLLVGTLELQVGRDLRGAVIRSRRARSLLLVLLLLELLQRRLQLLDLVLGHLQLRAPGSPWALCACGLGNRHSWRDGLGALSSGL